MDRPRRVVDRQRTEDPGLRLGVLEDGAAPRLDEEELAGSEAPTPDSLSGGERHGAGLRGNGHKPVARDGEGRRPKSVSIDERADAAAVGEREGCGAVPRREETGRPAAQRRDMRMRRAAK